MSAVQLVPKDFNHVARLLTRDALNRMKRYGYGSHSIKNWNDSDKIGLEDVLGSLSKSNGNPVPAIRSIIDSNAIAGKKLSSKQRRTFYQLVHDINKVGSLENPQEQWITPIAPASGRKAAELFNNNPLREVIDEGSISVDSAMDAELMKQPKAWLIQRARPNVAKYFAQRYDDNKALKELPDNLGRSRVPLDDEEMKQMAQMKAAYMIAGRNAVNPNQYVGGVINPVNFRTIRKLQGIQSKAMENKKINIAGNPKGTPTTFSYPETELINKAYKLSGGDNELLKTILTLAKGFEGTAEDLVMIASMV